MDADSFPHRLVLTIAAVGLALRLAFGLGYWVGEPLNRDEVEYLSLARSLTAGDGYRYDEHVLKGDVQPFGRAPGYPAFLALIGAGREYVEHVPASVKIAQSLTGAIGVYLIGLAAFRMAGRRPALAAAAIAAIFPPLVWIAGYAYSEAVFWPVGLGLALLTSRTLEDPHGPFWKYPLAIGIFAGFAILLRAATLLFVPVLTIWLVWRRQWRSLAGVVIGLVIVLSPWAAHISRQHGRFVLVASDGGVTFWTGNNPEAIGEGDMAANPHLKFANQALRARHPGLNEEQMEPIYYRESLTWMRQYPLDWLTLMVKKAFFIVVPIGPSYRLHSPRYFWASVLSVTVLVPLAVAGGWRLGPRRRHLVGMWLLAAAAVATCLVFFPQERFRIPVIDPALILLASGLWAVPHYGSVTSGAARRAA